MRKFIDSSKPLLANNVSTRLGDVGVVPQNATSMTLRVPRSEDMDDIVDPMVRVREGGVNVLQKANGPAFWPIVDAAVAHAALLRLIEAAGVLRD